ncbi:hypothetical protein AJ79_04474 [Helicocarpus griseus UAMH5409]|uniref:GPI anchored protein n=1 Tax=Helicocarpus griseus UAMH5409 TaxID=1447875 RepID=A0A2B7XT03_9EURO|nr:hypothetical protein AJ79_04474 [Helicocarpus griseus UAMH5409]
MRLRSSLSTTTYHRYIHHHYYCHRLVLIIALFISASHFLTSATATATTDAPREFSTSVADNDVAHDNKFELIRREDAEAQQRLAAGQVPAGVRKMSADEGEKFWLGYWYFEDGDGGLQQQQQHLQQQHLQQQHLQQKQQQQGWDGWLNSSGSEGSLLYPAFPLHAKDWKEKYQKEGEGGRGRPGLRLFDRSLRWWTARDPEQMFGERGFECPVGTEPCASIDRPDSCCGRGSRCIRVKDTGLGDVGCCGEKDKCEGGLVECAEGFSSCPGYLGGGCCIPGYECADRGCIFISTTTVTASPPHPPPHPPLYPPSYPTTTQPIAPPYRPTSNPITTITTTPFLTTSPPTNLPCPTGFYACSAIYHGGCCRTGRDCNPTSCPTVSSTTIVDDSGATIVVPVDAGATSGPGGGEGGRCARGWRICGVEEGGGCCPEGFRCGRVSCTAGGEGFAGTAVVGKMGEQNGGGRLVLVGGIWIWGLLMVVMVI